MSFELFEILNLFFVYFNNILFLLSLAIISNFF